MMQAFVVVNVPVCDESVKSQKEDVQYSFHMLIHYLSYDGLKLLSFLEGIHISNQIFRLFLSLLEIFFRSMIIFSLSLIIKLFLEDGNFHLSLGI